MIKMNKKNDDGIVEFICKGGYGAEAEVEVQLRTKFPGLGGTIITQEGAVSALRKSYSYSLGKSGHIMFLRHMIIKKIEDYFYRNHVYNSPHIPRPLGSISEEKESCEAYMYEWVFGSEGFPWEEKGLDGNTNGVTLNEWNKFLNNFNSAGIDLGMDVTDADDGRMSKNIIHQFPLISSDSEMSSIWKRIDFGFSSININYDKLSEFLYKKRESLIKTLRYETRNKIIRSYWINSVKSREIKI